MMNRLKELISGFLPGNLQEHVERVQDLASGFDPADAQQYLGYLEGISYPAGKDEILATIESNGGPTELIDRVRGANLDQFNGVQDVITAVRGR